MEDWKIAPHLDCSAMLERGCSMPTFLPSSSRPFLLSFILPLLLSFLPFLLTACANPVMPSGGPRDTTPPFVASSAPEPGETNVTRETVRITFSEYVEAGSFAQAVTASPPFDGPLEFDWSGRTVEIAFPQPLRDTTTYILTIGTDLTDTRGVALDQPITLAFSTGPTINRGRLGGSVVSAATGDPMGRMDVYAYAAPDSTLPDSLPERPIYRTQTGSDGQFRFEYLREQPYYVVALRDLNRNRQPDPLEAFAVPPAPVYFADTSGAPVAQPWVAAARDAQAPQVAQLDAPSAARLILRFDEPVRLAQPAPEGWTLLDSTAAEERSIEAIYQQEPPAPEVVLRTEPLAEREHRLTVPAGAVVDTSGNAVGQAVARVTPPAEADTAQTRFLAFVPPADTTALLLPGTAPGVRFSQPVDTTQLRTWLAVQDTSGAARPFTLASAEGTTTYRLTFAPPLAQAPVRLQLDARALPAESDTTYTRRFRTYAADELGELSGPVRLVALDPARAVPARVDTARVDSARVDSVAADTARADSARAPRLRGGRLGARVAGARAGGEAAIIVELIPVSEGGPVGRRSVQVGADGRFLFEQIPGERSFRYRAFLDRNGNGRWDPGRILPYRPAEPITWRAEPIQSRARWDVALPDTLRLAPR